MKNKVMPTNTLLFYISAMTKGGRNIYLSAKKKAARWLTRRDNRSGK
ncbi:hypothetical protein [Aeromonas dhakensis]